MTIRSAIYLTVLHEESRFVRSVDDLDGVHGCDYPLDSHGFTRSTAVVRRFKNAGRVRVCAKKVALNSGCDVRHSRSPKFGSRFRTTSVTALLVWCSFAIPGLAVDAEPDQSSALAAAVLTEPGVPFLQESNFPTVRLRGRIDTDGIFVNQSTANEQIFGPLDNQLGLRRARIGVQGEFNPATNYVAEIDLATGEVVLRDLYIAHHDAPSPYQFRVGRMREPFSLEGGTSANSFAFMERSPINVLDPARNWGLSVGINGLEENWTFVSGLFQSGTDGSDLQFGSGSTTDFTARGTFLPLYDDAGEYWMHIGGAASVRIPNQGVIAIRAQPSSPLLTFDDSTESPFVSRLSLRANSQELFNLQWAAANGSIWAQAEWYGTVIDQEGGGPVFLHGSHVDLGWFITGEHRKYQKQSGVFGAVSVKRPVFPAWSVSEHRNSRGVGAWELAARFSYLDSVDSDLPTSTSGQPMGVRFPQLTLGLNWYLADRMRLMFNYTYAVPDQVQFGASTANVFGVRFATFW